MAAKKNVIVGLVLGALFCGLVAAAQVSHGGLVNMRVDESMSGPLSRSSYREFTADYLFDGQRYYRVDVDAQGNRSELYRQDGVRKPVDTGVRSWVAEMVAMHTHTAQAASGG
jgi:predicted glycosyl hydrolase (DUF1957 family)